MSVRFISQGEELRVWCGSKYKPQDFGSEEVDRIYGNLNMDAGSSLKFEAHDDMMENLSREFLDNGKTGNLVKQEMYVRVVAENVAEVIGESLVKKEPSIFADMSREEHPAATVKEEPCPLVADDTQDFAPVVLQEEEIKEDSKHVQMEVNQDGDEASSSPRVTVDNSARVTHDGEKSIYLFLDFSFQLKQLVPCNRSRVARYIFFPFFSLGRTCSCF